VADGSLDLGMSGCLPGSDKVIIRADFQEVEK